MIVGITGTIGSGKGEFANFLCKEKSFLQFSFGNLVREEATRRGIELTRKNLIDLGKKIPEEHGKDFWVDRIIQKIEENQPNDIVVEGFRGPYGLAKIREKFGKKFILVSIDADQEIRWKRVASRNRENDPLVFADFLKTDALDRGIDGTESFFKTDECMKMADYTIMNNGSMEDFKKDILDLLKRISC